MHTLLLFYNVSGFGILCPLAPIIVKVMECHEMYCTVYYLGRY